MHISVGRLSALPLSNRRCCRCELSGRDPQFEGSVVSESVPLNHCMARLPLTGCKNVFVRSEAEAVSKEQEKNSPGKSNLAEH